MAPLRNRPRLTITLPEFMTDWLRGRVSDGHANSISDEVESAVASWMILNKDETVEDVVSRAWDGEG